MRWAPHRSVAGAATAIAVALALAGPPGCGIPQRAARGATEGAIQTLASKAGNREAVKGLTEGIMRRTAGGLTDELSQPQQLADLQRIAAALGTGTVAGAARAAAGQQGRQETQGATPVEAIAEQAASAFSRRMVTELGPAGDGPLGTSLSATTGQVTESIAHGVRSELAPLLPECQGADASRCLDGAVGRVSRASAAGVAAGIRDGLGVWLLVLVFGAGALFALALAWAGAVYHAVRHPAPAFRGAPRAWRRLRGGASTIRRRGD